MEKFTLIKKERLSIKVCEPFDDITNTSNEIAAI